MAKENKIVTVLQPDIVLRLENAFKIDATDEEACIWAGITIEELKDYEKNNPMFLKRKQEIRNEIVLIAKKTCVQSMLKNPVTASMYLNNKKIEKNPPPQKKWSW